MLAIIGGSGLSQLADLEVTERRALTTPYGDPSGPVALGRLVNRPVAFLARHGYGHTIAPHQVNYRANVWALRELGVAEIVSVASVGGIRPDLGPGALALPHQILDYTAGRSTTFFEGAGAPVTHVDFTEPYSPDLRARLLAAARRCGEAVADRCVYATTQGPRLETAAEIDRLERDGADVVGMTGMPEAVLARELALGYASLAVVANFAAGRGDSARRVALENVEPVLAAAMGRVRSILAALVGE